MGRVVVSEFVSLDGVMEAPGGEPDYPHTGWVINYFSPEIGAYKLAEIQEATAHLLGRVTYESFAGAWPERTDPDGYSDKINAMPKYVVSRTLKQATWNNSHVVSDIADVAKLKAEIDGVLLVAGSRTLTHALMAHDLVDEYRLMVFPLILGSGRRFYPETPDKQRLVHKDVRVLGPNGVVVHHYEPAPRDDAGPKGNPFERYTSLEEKAARLLRER